MSKRQIIILVSTVSIVFTIGILAKAKRPPGQACCSAKICAEQHHHDKGEMK